MLKSFGVLMLVCSCFIFVKSQYSSENNKIKQIGDFCDLLNYAKNRIDLYSEPQRTIFLSRKEKIFDDFNISKVPEDFCQLLSESKIICGKEAEIVLKSFATDFGKIDKNLQVKMCEKTILELENIKAKTVDERNKKIKSRTAFFALVVGVLLILLL